MARPRTCSSGKLAGGCKLCISAKVLPIYITFKCNKSCFYCPVLPTLQGRDFILTPYRKISKIGDLLQIAAGFEAASISGGDPLCVPGRAAKVIKALKEKFGKGFYILLYTNAGLLTAKLAKKLADAGLDEMKLHSFDLNRFKIAKKYIPHAGAEVVVVPGEKQKLQKLILSLDALGIEFINLNELEVAELNLPEIKKRGYKLTRKSIAGSAELGKFLVKEAKRRKLKIAVHYCSVKEEADAAERRDRRHNKLTKKKK
ncbi:MAG: radical SAM protein [Candidatus Diapherotrites archaeon]|uniref:Radical SAM protein n=1 Tax=Candidatus Iainarchaeum sp. TaxID=3101447 RepID=A0A8T4L200_9ARCH|nr:radical SAM protein [Candidatus Diapherotrites archaeon]